MISVAVNYNLVKPTYYPNNWIAPVLLKFPVMFYRAAGESYTNVVKKIGKDTFVATKPGGEPNLEKIMEKYKLDIDVFYLVDTVNIRVLASSFIGEIFTIRDPSVFSLSPPDTNNDSFKDFYIIGIDNQGRIVKIPKNCLSEFVNLAFIVSECKGSKNPTVCGCGVLIDAMICRGMLPDKFSPARLQQILFYNHDLKEE